MSMLGRASLINARISPRKARTIINTVRGCNANDCVIKLKLHPAKAASIILGVLKSAISNSQFQNTDLDTNKLMVCTAKVDEGQTMKRSRPGSRGRAARFTRRMSHICIHLGI